MSTPESNGGVPPMPAGPVAGAEPPGELRLAGPQLPRHGDTPALPSAAASTPGISGASARVPGSPTLPDFDPSALTLVVSRLAQELFASPMTASSAPSSPSPPPSSPGFAFAPSLPTAFSIPMDVSSAPAAPVAPASPFDAPLAFDVLGTPSDPFLSLGAASFPLLENEAAPSRDVAEAPPAIPEALGYEITPTSAPAPRSTQPATFDAHALKREFPILRESVHGKRLVWLDNAATTQKPQSVIDRLSFFYEHENSNVHRAAHALAARATDAYESARESVRRFVNAPSTRDVIFVRGATEGINLVAKSWGKRNVRAGDEIVISWLEHHANIVPWQQLCAETGAHLRVAPVDDRGQILLDEYEKLLGPKTRLVAFSQVSNALGTITPAREMVEIAHRYGAHVLVDGAQAVSHMRVDVQALGCDFYVFSGHKVFAPTGIGAVFAKSDIMDATPPWQGGGNMIQDVTFERTVYQPAPARFEAGTGNIADAVGLGAALDWLTRVGLEQVERHEHDLLVYATEKLRHVRGLTMIGTAAAKAGVLSFILAGQKTEAVGGLLDRDGIAVRSGHHCAQPILRRFGVEATVRASLAPYNTHEDIDALVDALHRIQASARS